MSKEKCKVIKNDVIPCEFLQSVTEFEGNRKGVSFLQFYNLNTMEKTRSLYQIKSGQRTKKGLIINFCPFCGENISSHLGA